MKKDNTVSVLFIGNSLTFFNQMPDELVKMAESTGKKLEVNYELTIGGATLKDFWDEGKALTEIQTKKWDYVVLQEQSETPRLNNESFTRYVKLFNDEIIKNNGKTILYMTNIGKVDGEFDEQQQILHNQAYADLAKEINAILVPAGEAWLKVLQDHPDTPLYRPDDLHPSSLGSYLIGLVFYGVLYEEDPKDITEERLSNTDQTHAGILKNIAWEVVNN